MQTLQILKICWLWELGRRLHIAASPAIVYVHESDSNTILELIQHHLHWWFMQSQRKKSQAVRYGDFGAHLNRTKSSAPYWPIQSLLIEQTYLPYVTCLT
ncbi:hypothetical protein AVEN_136927-1 [Araneus ventricosus]|uniref:Uncharacterized protein n=1 Tax=Araneus ventricosus TaxID=182803 RepID=A0A4Y2BHA6_ARAVE|nr:hypothetical protein AVEN_136927-1 [Araneus ventricosus]